MDVKQEEPISIFFSYARKDEHLCSALENHLASLKNQCKDQSILLRQRVFIVLRVFIGTKGSMRKQKLFTSEHSPS